MNSSRHKRHGSRCYATESCEEAYYKLEYKHYLDEDGTLLGVLCIATEVTELVEARQELQRRLDELTASTNALVVAERLADDGRLRQRVFEQAPLAICVLNGVDFRTDFMNPQFAEILDCEPGEVLEKPFFESFPDTKGQGFEQLLNQVLDTGVAVSFDGHPVSLMRNGSVTTVYLDYVYQPYRDKLDQVLGITVLVVEVTAQHEAREQLAANAERFRKLMSGLPHMTWSSRPDGVIDYRNELWWTYTGLSPDSKLANNWIDCLHPDDRESIVAAYTPAMQIGEAEVGEVGEVTVPDGKFGHSGQGRRGGFWRKPQCEVAPRSS